MRLLVALVALGGLAATPDPPPPLPVATRVPATGTTAKPPAATGVLMGERWGCASYETGSGTGYQCWDAGPAPRAWRVPWMDGQRFQTAPDHLCALASRKLSFGCWERPVRGEATGRPLPDAARWTNPHGAGWKDSTWRADRVERAEVGATFSCLQTTKDSGVFCIGDDRFGQRGGSNGPPAPDADPDDPAFVQNVRPARFMAMGTWHACAFTAPAGMAQGGRIACWGRGDHGQLGVPAPDSCQIDGRDIPCARTPIKGVEVPRDRRMLTLAAGDLFTCMTDDSGIKCWGATRDAIFGVPGSCPESLRRAWPTLHGPVTAPRAACSSNPVPVPGVTGFQPQFIARPRALCFGGAGNPTCLGGLPKARGLPQTGQTVSPGSDASACKVHEGRVFCWGEAYSRPDALDVPVSVNLEPTSPIGETAVVRLGARKDWDDPRCLARRGCTIAATPLPRCAPAGTGGSSGGVIPTWSELAPRAAQLSGRDVRVRGPLHVGSIGHTMMGCSTKTGKPGCCNRAGGEVFIGGDPQPLPVHGLYCAGDDSQVCCNAPAYGQTVVATGRLTAIANATPHESQWMLTSAVLCNE